MKKCLLSFLILFLSAFGPCTAQDSEVKFSSLGKDLWTHSGRLLKEIPQEKTWAYLGISGASVLAVMSNDLPLQRSMQLRDSRFKNTLNDLSEAYGNPIYMGSLSLGTYLLSTALDKPDLQDLSSTALQAMAFSGSTVMGLKLLFHRWRPEEQLELDPYQFDGPSLNQDQLSFPSGHSVIAFSFAASVSAHFEDKWYVAIPLYGLASLTAWQRVYDFKHWPSDVLGGAILGVLIGRQVAAWQKEGRTKLSFGSDAWGRPSIGLHLKID